MTITNELRGLSRQDLALLGVQDVAYVRAVRTRGRQVFKVYAADGTEIAVLDDRDVAFATVRQHGLEPLSVH